MFLKIQYGDAIFKTIFKDEHRSFEKLSEYVANKIGMKQAEMALTYKDSEGDTLILKDNEDMEYFIEESKSSDFKQLRVTRKLSHSHEKPNLNFLYPKHSEELNERKRRMTKNRGQMDELTISTIIYKDENEEGDDATMGDFGFAEADEEKQRKSTVHANSVIAIENCFAQLMSQFMDMKMAYEYKLNQIDTNQRRFEYSLISIKNKLETQNSTARLNKSNISIGVPHINVRCNNCGMLPITGKRYKCLECKEFNLCEGCESQDVHEHDMKRILAQVKVGMFNGERNDAYSETATPETRKAPSRSLTIDQTYKNLLEDKWPVTQSKGAVLNLKKSLKDLIVKHIQNDREEYEKRKNLLDITFGDQLTNEEKHEIINKDQESSFDDFSNKLASMQNMIDLNNGI